MADYPPVIVLVDIDGTIIGDIDAQLTEYQHIVQSHLNATVKQVGGAMRVKMFKDRLVTQLINGLMRPGFSQFCAQCHMLRIPVMIYTAADHDWAHFLVPRIQQAVQMEMARDLEDPPKHFRFSRLFTRNNCEPDGDMMFKKSLERVKKDIYATLKKNYTMRAGMDGVIKRTILIDNTDGILVERDHLVVVPTYKFAYIYDVTENMDHTDKALMQKARAELYAKSSFLGGRNASTTLPFRAWLYTAMADNIRSHSEYDNMRRTDPLWHTLRRRIVEYMNDDTNKTSSGPRLAEHLLKGGRPTSSRKYV